MEPRDRSPSGSLGLTKTCPGAPGWGQDASQGRLACFPAASRAFPGRFHTLPNLIFVSKTLPDAPISLQDASKTPENAFGHLQDGQIIYFLRFLVRKRKQIGRQNTMKIDHGARHEENLPVLQKLSFFE